MVKKIFKGMVVAALAMSLTVNVMAAKSVVGSFDMGNVSSDDGINVTVTEIKEDMYEEELQDTVETINSAPADSSVKEAFGTYLPTTIDLYNKEGMQKKNVDLSVYKFLTGMFELKVENNTGGFTVTFVANNMTSRMEVDVLHYCDEHGWEVLEGKKVGNNQVSAHFHSNSPVALIYRMVDGGTGDTGADSPQTGEVSMMPIFAGMAALICVGGYAVVRSKKEA